MTIVKKRITAILLTLALIITMMPLLAVQANAADDAAFGIAINGSAVNVKVTKQQLEKNAFGPQIFPFAAGQGKQWNYAVADGASYEYVLCEALQINSLDRIETAAINWNDENDSEAGKFDLTISDLQELKDQFRLIDQNGQEIKGAFNVDDITSAEAVSLDGAANVTPIIAYKYKMYDSYAEALAAKEDGSWETGAKAEVRPFVGGNLNKETFLKENGKVNPGALNFTGKFSIVAGNPGYSLNIKNYEINLPDKPETDSIRMTVGDAAKKISSKVYTSVELDYLDAVWECDNADVIRVDEFGSITPVKAGTCTVTATVYEEGTTNVLAKIGEWKVTVADKAKPAPSKPASLKVKNVKKKTAKLTWKKAANAEGYEVYRSVKKKKGFKKAATVKTATYKNKKLKKGKTYYFKVRSFNVVNGKKVYSSFSSVKKVKIKK